MRPDQVQTIASASGQSQSRRESNMKPPTSRRRCVASTPDPADDVARAAKCKDWLATTAEPGKKRDARDEELDNRPRKGRLCRRFENGSMSASVAIFRGAAPRRRDGPRFCEDLAAESGLAQQRVRQKSRGARLREDPEAGKVSHQLRVAAYGWSQQATARRHDPLRSVQRLSFCVLRSQGPRKNSPSK